MTSKTKVKSPVVSANPGSMRAKQDKAKGLKFIFRAFKYRNYRLFFGGQGISLIGTWMQQIALAWLVYRLTNSAFLLGIVSFSGHIPVLFFASFGGVLADRYNRRRILLTTQTLSMLQACTLAVLVLSGHIQVWQIITLSVILGTINSFDIPARQSFIVQMVERKEDLGNAIALNSSMFNGARLIGPSIAGMLIALVGEGLCFLLNGVSYIAVILALLAMKINEKGENSRIRGYENDRIGEGENSRIRGYENGRIGESENNRIRGYENNPLGYARGKLIEEGEKRANKYSGETGEVSVLQGLKEGFLYVFGSVPMRSIILLLCVVSLVGMPYAVLMPIIAKNVLLGGPRTLGFLMGAMGCGALTGALYLASRKNAVGLEKIMPVATCIFGIGLIAISQSRVLAISLPLMMLTGFGMIVQMASGNTVLQTVVDDNKRGRVMSFYSMAFMGAAPFGSLLAGTLASKIGAPNTLLMGGILCIAAGGFFANKLLPLGKLIHSASEEFESIPTKAELSTPV